MSLPQFFLDTQVLENERAEEVQLVLCAEDLRHMRALRLSAGERFAVIDAASDYFVCEFMELLPTGAAVRIAQREEPLAQGPQVTLIAGIGKGDKLDTVVRQGTELGVSAFVPFMSERTIVRLKADAASKRQERLAAVARSAAMQSGQRQVPAILPVCERRSLCALLAGYDALLLFWEEAPLNFGVREAFAQLRAEGLQLAASLRIAVMVGPEGGFSAAEVDEALAACPRSAAVSLGPSILRAETAGVIAPALVLHALGRLGDAPDAVSRP